MIDHESYEPLIYVIPDSIRNPSVLCVSWIPAFTGMTLLNSSLVSSLGCDVSEIPFEAALVRSGRCCRAF
jgi:hypothetical protein